MIGVGVFVAYLKRWNDHIVMHFIGPPIYLSYYLKNYIGSYLSFLPSSSQINQFLFLMPVTIFYFGFMGALFKILWNERGIIKFLSLSALFFFLIYIHYKAGLILMGYLTPYP